MFAKLIEQVELSQPVVFEVNEALAGLSAKWPLRSKMKKRKLKATRKEKKTEAEKMLLPSITPTPKPKKAPQVIVKSEEKKPEVKAMPRKAEKETRYDDDEKERKKARYESRPSRPEDGEMVPKEFLNVPVSQEIWSVLGKDSRVGVLSEKPTNETCFFCQQKGHRAFYCSSMLVLGLRLSRFMGQVQFGGGDRKTNLFCTSCYFYNSYQRASKNYSTRDGTGWYNHTRSTCSGRSSCPLPAVYVEDADAELRRNLRLHGLYGPRPSGAKK